MERYVNVRPPQSNARPNYKATVLTVRVQVATAFCQALPAVQSLAAGAPQLATAVEALFGRRCTVLDTQSGTGTRRLMP